MALFTLFLFFTWLDISKIPLTFLNVSANMLTRLPPSLRHINTLTHFYCENNPLEWPPAQVSYYCYYYYMFTIC